MEAIDINDAVKNIIVNYSDINYRLGDSRARADILRALCIKRLNEDIPRSWQMLGDVSISVVLVMEALGFAIPEEILDAYRKKEAEKEARRSGADA